MGNGLAAKVDAVTTSKHVRIVPIIVALRNTPYERTLKCGDVLRGMMRAVRLRASQ